MRKKAFSLAQLLLAMYLTAGCRAGRRTPDRPCWMGGGWAFPGGGARLVNTSLWGNMTRQRWWTPLEGAWCQPGRPLELLPDGWMSWRPRTSATNQYVGVGAIRN